MANPFSTVTVRCPLCGESITLRTTLTNGLHSTDRLRVYINVDSEPIIEHAAKHRGPDGDGGEPAPVPQTRSA